MSVKEGIVVRAVSGVYSVQSNAHVVHCTLRGNLKKAFEFTTSGSNPRRVTRAKRQWVHDTVSIGDHVKYVETKHGAGVIEEVLPRKTAFARSGFRGKEQTIVSNLDQLVIVFAPLEPRLDPWKLDRFLIASEASEIQPLIVANKCDLASEEEIDQAFGPFAQLGYRVLPTSVKASRGLDELRDALKDRVSAFVGPSGVGKSSLLNAVQPGLNLKIGDIGYVTFKGRHTTTASQLIPFRFGGWVADTPGLRDLELATHQRDQLEHSFPEFGEFLGKCRFQDCKHEKEPGCAIKAAVEEGQIQPRRYESFVALAGES